MYPKHDEDHYGWVTHTAQLLRDGKMNEIDFDGIIEELEEMGISNRQALKNRLAQLIFHLLKWQFQPDFRGRSWEGSIENQRDEIKLLLAESPSLKSKIKDCFPIAYKKSKLLVKQETPIELKLLPQECPYAFEQLMDDEFFPK